MPGNDMHAGQTARPQNKSYPAGGIQRAHPASASDLALRPRGVLVAPPSENTSPPHSAGYQVLHKGFDTLALSVQANIPSDLFEHLNAERDRAEKEAKDVLTEYNGIQFHLKPHGTPGYRFIASGGQCGATWFFKKPNDRDKWGIRVSFGSFYLAVFARAAAREHLDTTLARLGVRFGEQDVSIGRADFCIDVLAPGFELIPANFVMRSGTNRREVDSQMKCKSCTITEICMEFEAWEATTVT